MLKKSNICHFPTLSTCPNLWKYAKLGFEVLAVIGIIVVSCCLDPESLGYEEITFLAATAIVLSGEAVFTALSLNAGDKQNIKVLRLSYMYSVVVLILTLVGSGWFAYSGIYSLVTSRDYQKVLEVGLEFVGIFLQVYLVLVKRWEIKAWQNQDLEAQFTNNKLAGEPPCTLHRTHSDLFDTVHTVTNGIH